MRVLRIPPLLVVLVCLVLGLSLTACAIDPSAAPTLTPDPALDVTAAALFPTRVPTQSATATPVARGDDSEQIARLLGNIENAVMTNDMDAYRTYVDLETDPVFGLEHTRWIEDLAERSRVLRFDVNVRNLTIDGDVATADLNMTWTVLLNINVSRGADFPAIFRRGADGRWRYAGEDWATVIETEHFRVKALAGLEDAAEFLPDVLPDVYARVTDVFDHAPEGISEIKLYDNPWTLVATTRLSLTSTISGWNEPGEALKLLVGDEPPEESLLAHEFGHYVMFDLAGTTRGNWPWWVSEGMAEYASSTFWTQTERNSRIRRVNDLRDPYRLPEWNAIRSFEDTPEELWQYAYLMGYTFVAYITDEYGDAARNEWLRGMIDGSLEDATQATFDMPFEDLSAGYFAWLDTQAG